MSMNLFIHEMGRSETEAFLHAYIVNEPETAEGLCLVRKSSLTDSSLRKYEGSYCLIAISYVLRNTDGLRIRHSLLWHNIDEDKYVIKTSSRSSRTWTLRGPPTTVSASEWSELGPLLQRIGLLRNYAQPSGAIVSLDADSSYGISYGAEDTASSDSSGPSKSVSEASKSSSEKSDTSNVEDNNTCIVCMDASITHTTVPCGHLKFCETCSAILKARNDPCPVCRGAVTNYMKVFSGGFIRSLDRGLDKVVEKFEPQVINSILVQINQGYSDRQIIKNLENL